MGGLGLGLRGLARLRGLRARARARAHGRAKHRRDRALILCHRGSGHLGRPTLGPRARARPAMARHRPRPQAPSRRRSQQPREARVESHRAPRCAAGPLRARSTWPEAILDIHIYILGMIVDMYFPFFFFVRTSSSFHSALGLSMATLPGAVPRNRAGASARRKMS